MLKGQRGARSIAAVAALAALLLLACGEATAEEPFAGTWGDADGGTVAVIAALDEGYRVTVFEFPLANAERRGDQLRAWTELRSAEGELTGERLEAVFTYEAETGRLIFTDPAGPGVRIELVRSSEATAIPSPWPNGAE
jgi:hypothetical protein